MWPLCVLAPGIPEGHRLREGPLDPYVTPSPTRPHGDLSPGSTLQGSLISKPFKRHTPIRIKGSMHPNTCTLSCKLYPWAAVGLCAEHHNPVLFR